MGKSKDKKREEFVQSQINNYDLIQRRKYLIIVCLFFLFFYLHIFIIKILFCLLLFDLIRILVLYRSKWKSISGPTYLNMDTIYEYNIKKKFIPRFNKEMSKYGITLILKPLKDDPGMQTYIGFDSDHNKIRLTFYNNHVDMVNENKYRYPMLLVIDYKDNFDDVIGEIDLSNKANVNNCISLIREYLLSNKLIEEDKDTYDE